MAGWADPAPPRATASRRGGRDEDGRRLVLVALDGGDVQEQRSVCRWAGTVATIVSVSDDPAAGFAGTLGAVQVTAPLLPTAGVVHVNGDSAVALTNGSPGGS